MEKEVIVFRYGHRAYRDERVTSHCCLVARAFGAQKIIIEGPVDKTVKESVDTITDKWGGPFEVVFEPDWRRSLKAIKAQGYRIVHLSMYGLRIQDVSHQLQGFEKVCVVIGSQKVEKEVYAVADHNVSVTTQPHSEIAALTLALDRVFDGKELEKTFSGAKVSIEPQQQGKKLEKV
jgi:tRNA (cytidine56-2'-O)-methyltransferase